MGWINTHWGLPQVPNASTSPPHEVVLALDKVVEQIYVSMFLVQLTIEGAPTMLSLEKPLNFTSTLNLQRPNNKFLTQLCLSPFFFIFFSYIF
jgi:hypothetical protein